MGRADLWVGSLRFEVCALGFGRRAPTVLDGSRPRHHRTTVALGRPFCVLGDKGFGRNERRFLPARVLERSRPSSVIVASKDPVRIDCFGIRVPSRPESLRRDGCIHAAWISWFYLSSWSSSLLRWAWSGFATRLSDQIPPRCTRGRVPPTSS